MWFSRLRLTPTYIDCLCVCECMCTNEAVCFKRRRAFLATNQGFREWRGEMLLYVTRLVGDLQGFFHLPINTEEIQQPGHNV